MWPQVLSLLSSFLSFWLVSHSNQTQISHKQVSYLYEDQIPFLKEGGFWTLLLLLSKGNKIENYDCSSLPLSLLSVNTCKHLTQFLLGLHQRWRIRGWETRGKKRKMKWYITCCVWMLHFSRENQRMEKEKRRNSHASSSFSVKKVRREWKLTILELK